MRRLVVIVIACALFPLTSIGGIQSASAAASSPWTFTGSMSQARHFHTATALPDGRVLVTGGQPHTATAELYNPASGTWSPTGSMAAARSFHTATLLQDGRVLVVGGNLSPTDKPEIFNPSTNTWSATPPTTTPRSLGHTATLLMDGRVLVTGGQKAEIYDPASNTWTQTANLIASRENHTATLLGDGRVLIAGGASSNIALASAEIFDPTTRTWSPTGSLKIARYFHVATLLNDGRVLVTGGVGNGVTANSELYNPSNGTWSPGPLFSTQTYRHTATLLTDGRVLVAAGEGPKTTELYDPISNTRSPAGSMNKRRQGGRAVRLADGKVLMTGGCDGGEGCLGTSAEVYDPAFVDTLPPTIPKTTKPAGAFQLQTKIPVAWKHSTDLGLGVANYDLRYRAAPFDGNFGSHILFKTQSANSTNFTGTPGFTYAFSVRARDWSGNVSNWSAEKFTALPLDDRALTAQGSWQRLTGSGLYLGTFSQSSTQGDSLTLSGAKAKRLAVVATKCPGCGSVELVWNNVVQQVINLDCAAVPQCSGEKKLVLFQANPFGSVQNGTLILRVSTSGKAVKIDGVGVSQN